MWTTEAETRIANDIRDQTITGNDLGHFEYKSHLPRNFGHIRI